jgi:hypothetical protein
MDVSGSIRYGCWVECFHPSAHILHSNIGQYCASVAAVARAAWFVSQDSGAKILPTFVGWSYDDGVMLSPVAAIAITSLAMFALTAISFE